MRKKSLVIGVILLVTVLAAIFCACDGKTDSGVKLVDIEVTSVPEQYVLGEPFDLGDIIIKATYSNGTEKTFSLTDEMLNDDDKEKFFTKGTNAVTVNYQDKSAVFQIKVVSPVEPTYYYARFFSNGGTEVAEQHTDIIPYFLDSTMEGYTFKGWYVTPDFEGNRVVAPYPLTQDTNFYAKWEDKRRRNVRFVYGDNDENELYNFAVVYGTGIDITDLETYKPPVDREGYRFSGWVLTKGTSTTDITEDIVLSASYMPIRCTMQITYWDPSINAERSKPITYNYGEYFKLSEYEIPVLEGKDPRWVVVPEGQTGYTEYYEYWLDHHADKDYIRRELEKNRTKEEIFNDFRENRTGAENFEDPTTKIKMVENLKIYAEQKIKTYDITIYNGVATQDKDLKVGKVNLDRVYADSKLKRDYFVDFNENFLLSEFNKGDPDPYLLKPASVADSKGNVGYDSQWCFVIDEGSASEVWRNARNQVWSEDEGKFVLEPGAEELTVFELIDKDGNYIATVRNGDLYNVKGNVTIKAKYYKKTYTITLKRKPSSDWVVIDTFSVRYMDDFKLYDPAIYTDTVKYGAYNLIDAAAIESYYQLYNVAPWSTQDADMIDKWQSIYYNGGNINDWAVEWYSENTMAESVRINFDYNAGSDTYGSYEVFGDKIIYCRDRDLRRYSVTLMYAYNFQSGDYTDYEPYTVTGTEVIEEPAGARTPIVRTYSYINEFGEEISGNVSYKADGWYDYPYSPDEDAYSGNKYLKLDNRTHNMVYYMHYTCTTTYTLTIYDTTQSKAYDECLNGSYKNKGYEVDGRNGIRYEIPAGTVFTSDMLYKAIAADGVSGQTISNKVAFIKYVLGDGADPKNNPDGELHREYEEILNAYGGGNHDATVTNLSNLISALTAEIEAYEGLLRKMYVYDYTVGEEAMTPSDFNACYMTDAEYRGKLNQRHEYNIKLTLVKAWADNYNLAKGYYDENLTVAGGKFKSYLNSEIDLNMAYNKDITVANPSYKYRFSGWYVDSSYVNLYHSDSYDMSFSWLACDDNLDLFAKWADEEKGSEGLVFKKVTNATGDIIGVVVVDFMSAADYAVAAFHGCGYNDFANFDYSVNLNDQNEMPVISDSSRIDIQIPASHGTYNGLPIPVIGIARRAFDNSKRAKVINKIMLSNNLQFIEEEAFFNCNLSSISGDGNAYYRISGERVVYQMAAYSYGGYSVGAQTLIAYANQFVGNDYGVFTVASETLRIADYAFFGATSLQYVALNNGLREIGAHAFENSALAGSVSDHTKLVLPTTLRTIEGFAFNNCAEIMDFSVAAGAALSYVGEKAFEATGWLKAQRGIVVINKLLVAVRGTDENYFDKDDGALRETTLADGTVAYSYTGTYGTLYYSVSTRQLAEIRVADTTISGIASYAFDGCTAKTIVISSALATNGIADHAFKDCVNLSEVSLPDLSMKVDETAFDGCWAVAITYGAGVRHASWDDCDNIVL